MRFLNRPILYAVFMIVLIVGPAQASESLYDPSQGLYPDELSCAPWDFFSGNYFGLPVTGTSELLDSSLEISSTGPRDYYYFFQDFTDVSLPETLVIETSLKVNRYEPDLRTQWYLRGVASLSIKSSKYTTGINIQKGSMHMASGELSIYDPVDVESDDDYHTYRLELDSSTGTSRAYYDGELLIEEIAMTTNNPPATVGFSWGDGTNTTAGSTSWRYVKHNIIPKGCSIEVPVDIKPGSCPNPLNTKSNGVLSVAVAGTPDLDVDSINPSTISLSGISPIRYSYEDVATPYEPYAGKTNPDQCTTDGDDGYIDLILKFDKQEVIQFLEEFMGDNLVDGNALMLTVEGKTFDGTMIVGEDIVKIIKKGK